MDGVFKPELQKCVPCDKGMECITPPCVKCTACPAGFYKSVKGPIACTPCPADTYRTTQGARNLGDCLPCPEGADTRGNNAQIAITTCICAEAFYMSGSVCSLCPVGAGCNFGRSCALNSNATVHGPRSGVYTSVSSRLYYTQGLCCQTLMNAHPFFS